MQCVGRLTFFFIAKFYVFAAFLENSSELIYFRNNLIYLNKNGLELELIFSDFYWKNIKKKSKTVIKKLSQKIQHTKP